MTTGKISPDGNTDLIAAVTSLTGELTGLRADTEELRSHSRRNRNLIKLMAASVVFDILLSVGLAYSIYRTNDAAAAATRASSSQIVDCRAGNATKTVQRDLWDKVFSFPPPAAETPEAKATREERTAEFQAYLDEAFAQQDCGKGDR